MTYQLIITCEHASNAIPEEFHSIFFPEHARLLRTHRGWDIGALTVFQLLTQSIPCACIHGNWSRLVVDINRSVDNPQLLSDPMLAIEQLDKKKLLNRHYYPYRQLVERWITNAIVAKKSVIHLSIHSFTPELHGQLRTNDVGILFDPARQREKLFTETWIDAFAIEDSTIVTRQNYPYLGTEDGFTTYLRTRFNDAQYIGVELELNQRHFDLQGGCVTQIDDVVVETVHAAIEKFSAIDSNADSKN